ncbi:MAG: tetraacyldisaccharide 4'-kinase [Rhodospirillaceae bacterium]|nr:MAG: tetraacyldisaccharide 4'-kinase [Rhodospirillaceae bacterium]
MRPPEFWRTDNGVARLLNPIGRLVGAITTRRVLNATPLRASVPVISVGNLTVGGTGKTPVAMSIVTRLKARGLAPAVILRGYGGTLPGPVAVDPARHTAEDVGDEALLHAALAPTWVARSRAAGAVLATAAGASVIVLDDAHQHPSLAKDLSVIVIDGAAGFGNGRIVPAGPLRESVGDGLARTDAVVLMNDDRRNLASRLAAHVPVLRANLVPGPEQELLRGRRVVAFAGIGDPEKFFHTLRALGAQVVAKHPFDDHEGFGESDIQPILDEAYSLNAIPVTTAKDAVRLPPDQRQQVNVLSVGVEWADVSALDALLDRVLRTS